MQGHRFRWFLTACVWLPIATATTASPDAPAASGQQTPGQQELPEPADRVEQLVEKHREAVVVVRFKGRDGKTQGIGTGFVISDEGLIATNNHVLGEARPIEVEFADGTRAAATAVHAYDQAMDLAILKVDRGGLAFLKLGDSDKIRQGQSIVAIGNPVGLEHSVVRGVVSSVRKIENRQMIQMAIPIERGNSGGPVLDMNGRVLGLMNMKSSLTDNLGFAVPVNDLKLLIASPNPVPMSRWLTIGQLDPGRWQVLFGANWQRRSGRLVVDGAGLGFGGRSLCLTTKKAPEVPYELGVWVRLDNKSGTGESGAAGLVFDADGEHQHYGFYPSGGRMRLSRFDGPNVFSWNVLEEIATPQYRPGEWNHLKVRVEKERVKCYVNDALIVESTDRKLEPGRVGVAKFRDTRAEFKRFQVADVVTSGIPKPAAVAKARQTLAKIAGGTADALGAFDADAAAIQAALREERQQLHDRVNVINRLSRDVHVHDVIERLTKVMRADEANLAEAALLIAQLDDSDLDVAAYLQEVDEMANEVRMQLNDKATETDRLTALDRYLFRDRGFHGSRVNYEHRANSYLNRVIDDREGLPITLSVLYLEMGRRLDLDIVGVGLPGHFVVRYQPQEGEGQLIDVFHGGARMDREAAAQLVLRTTGRPLIDELMAATNADEIVLRMLRNLINNAQREHDEERMLGYLDATLAIDENLLEDRLVRAIVRRQTGRIRAALSDLDWFLQHEPAGINLTEIRRLRQRIENE